MSSKVKVTETVSKNAFCSITILWTH